MKPIAIILARMGSSRFPGKVMAEVAGKPILRHVYDRVMMSGVVRFCVVATDTFSPEIVDYCNRNGMIVFRGANQAGPRFRDAARIYADNGWCFRVNSDCPLLDPDSLSLLWAMMPDSVSVRYMSYRRESDSMPAVQTHQGLPELVLGSALTQIRVEHDEHVTRAMYSLPGECHWIDHPCDERNTVDTPEDLEQLKPRIQAVAEYERLKQQETVYPL